MKLLKEDRKDLCIVFLSIILFYIIAFRGIIFQSGHVYQNWDNAIPPFSIQLKNLAEFSESTWWSNVDMGTQGVWSGMTRYFDLIILNGLSFLGGKFLSKFLYLLYALIGGVGFWRICKELGWGIYTTLIVILISQFNPRAYSLAVSGHLVQQGFAYSLIPWVLFFIYKGVKGASFWKITANIIYAGIIGVLICSTSPISISFFIVFIALFLIACSLGKYWWKVFLHIATISIIVIILHLFWLVPAFVITKDVEASFKYGRTAEEAISEFTHAYHVFSPYFLNSIIGHTHINDMGREYAYPVIGRMEWLWKSAAYLLLIIAIFGFFFKTKYRVWKIFSILTILTGIVLFAGDKVFVSRFFYEQVLIKIKIIFFLMSRTSRWLFIYFTGFALMLGFAIDRLYKNKIVKHSLVLILAIYWFPYWSGSITRPKNDTSQTLALMPQVISDEEEKVVEQIAKEKGDHRVVILPTIAGPSGYIPEPPKSTYARNFSLFGKDTVIGPAFMGEPFSKYLLNLLHRECSYTDSIGRLLGLSAVKRILYAKNEKYYTYNDFGYMLHPNNSRETLFEPDNALERFIQDQSDLICEDSPEWRFDQVNIYRNTDYLPRIRMVDNAYYTSGGVSLLLSLSEMQYNFFSQNALFFAVDMDSESMVRLKQFWKGVVIYNNSWPELLMPFISEDYWHLASSNAIPDGWDHMKDVWHKELWFNSSVINNNGLISKEKTELIFSLTGNGKRRMFVCYGRRLNGGGIDFYLNDKNIGSDMDIEDKIRGVMWRDLGEIEFKDSNNNLRIEVSDKGVIIFGVLSIPSNIFNTAMEDFEEMFLDKKDIYLIAEAEAVAENKASVRGNRLIVPLLRDQKDRVKITMINTKDVPFDKEENRIISVEGDQIGEVIFEASFGENVKRCRLECYPGGHDFINAYFSKDGINYSLIFEYRCNRNDIYAWRQEAIFDYDGDKIYIKFVMSPGTHLASLSSGLNVPMRIIGEVKDVGGAIKSWGQAVNLPCNLNFYIPKAGKYHMMARMIGGKGEELKISIHDEEKTFRLNEDGATWVDMGDFDLDIQGPLKIKLAGSNTILCDLFIMESSQLNDKENEIGLSYNRVNPAKYDIEVRDNVPALLLFAEAYHQKWYFEIDGEIHEPIRSFGFMNAYPIDGIRDNHGSLYFKYQPIREYYWRISLLGWWTLIVFLFIYNICKIKK